jgi:hypothetical protein
MLLAPGIRGQADVDDPATEKAGSTENRDEPAMAGCAVGKVFCHGRQPACPPGRSEPTIPHEAERLHLSMLRRPCLSTLVNEQPGAPEGSISRLSLLPLRHFPFRRERLTRFERGTGGSNPCTLQSGHWLVGIVDWPNRAGLPDTSHRHRGSRGGQPAGSRRRRGSGDRVSAPVSARPSSHRPPQSPLP